MAKVQQAPIDGEFPKMLYKHGGEHELHGGKFSTRIVESAEAEEAAVAEGWFLTTPEAVKAAKPAENVGKPEGWKAK